MAKKAMINKRRENSQVFHQSLQQMQDLRQTARLFKKVRNMPYLLQRIGS